MYFSTLLNYLHRRLQWRMTPLLGILACIAIYLSVPSRAIGSFQKKCQSFAPEIYISNSTRQVVDYLPAGTILTFPENDPTCERPSQVVLIALCRVALSIATSTRSSTTVEIWLPARWSGRLLGTGNGGIDGCSYR